MSNARRRWRQKQKEQKKSEQLDRQTIGGAKDLTPRNAEALMRARDDDGKVSRVYVIEFK